MQRLMRCFAISALFVAWSQGAQADVCWKESYGRGAGTIPSDCGEFDKNGLLCYPRCNAGYTGKAFVCWQNCPAGFRDDGAFCAKPKPYGRGAGYSLLAKCNKENPAGCEKCLALSYPKCGAGFHAVGCNICTPDCPAGMTDIGVSCQKATYKRATMTPRCGVDKSYAAGLCYNSCKANFNGIGPVCWGTCPTGMTDCGALCGDSAKDCANAIGQMVLSVAQMIGKIAEMVVSGGTSAAADIAKESAESSLKEFAMQTAKDLAKELGTSAVTAIKAKILPELKKAGLSEKDAESVAEMSSNPEKFDYKAFLESVDPIGISKVVDAFNKKICNK